MPLAVLRRGITLGLALVIVVAGTVLADDVRPDLDHVTADNQGSVSIGQVAPGAHVGVDVPFAVICKGTNHLPAGSTIAVDAIAKTEPGDGSVAVTAGSIIVPANWPAVGAYCDGTESAPQVTPAHLAITAPSAEGTGYTFDVQFGLSEGQAANLIFASVTLSVVAPPPPPPTDTTDPVLSGVPADITVHTGGDGALVSWTDPTATDDTDTSPTVACDPARNSLFDIGTTTVTCTATDDAGNTDTATFTVTVVYDAPPPPPPPAPTYTGTWGRPLDNATPALVGRAGRTIPLKLDVRDGSALQGPADIDAPALRVERLATCAADGATTSTSGGGTFAWSGGAWQLNLDTSPYGSGCVRLVATERGATVATAIVQLVPEALATPAKGKGKR